MRFRLTRPLLATGLAAALAGGACSGGEQTGTTSTSDGSNVSVDADDGDLRVETDDGSFTIGTSELPDGWPEDIPLPPEHRLSSSMSSGADEDQSFSIGGTFPGPSEVAFDEVVDAFAANGWTEVQTASTDVGGSVSSSATFDNGTWTAVFSSTRTGAESTFAYTVVPSRT